MRLINTETGGFAEFIGRAVPPYAALSHTWGGDEVTFQAWSARKAAAPTGAGGFDKIKATCRLAARSGLTYAWLDTCCIDKTSSAELTEAINSMYHWYERSAVCYVHLADLDPSAADGSFQTALPACRWFTRGWTLQELIAPERVFFFDRQWSQRADKKDIVALLARITGIAPGVLDGSLPLAALPTAQKMSWAARRETTRVEDAAYCLLGIFDINMPLMYGERDKAFRRLQEEIIRTTSDVSIFAWRLPQPDAGGGDGNSCNGNGNSSSSDGNSLYCGFLASSPASFDPCPITSKTPFGSREEFSITNCGIKTQIRNTLYMTASRDETMYLFPVHWDRNGKLLLGVRMRKCGPNQYLRKNPWDLVAVDSSVDLVVPGPYKQKYLLTDIASVTRNHPRCGGAFITRADIANMRGHVFQLDSTGPLQIYDYWPEARCDPQDEVFFTSGNPWQDSAFVCFTLELTSPRQEYRFNVVCFVVGWSYVEGAEGQGGSVPQISIVPSEAGAVTDELLQKLKQKNYETERLLQQLNLSGVPKCSTASFDIPEQNIRASVSYTLSLKEDPEICIGKFWRVNLFAEAGPIADGTTVVIGKWIPSAPRFEALP